MAKMGDGYGSECHLLRYLGRHRQHLDHAVSQALGVSGDIRWVDFPFDPKAKWPDAEWKGLDFLRDDPRLGRRWPAIKKAWAKFWPQGRGIHNWDAVGWLESQRGRELLLVEAKAHLGEVRSNCTATSAASRRKIERSLIAARTWAQASPQNDWARRYYQFANRVAVLHFLQNELKTPIPARLLFVYFAGDRSTARRSCPQTTAGWNATLQAQDAYLGRPFAPDVEARIHKLFLHVTGPRGTTTPYSL